MELLLWVDPDVPSSNPVSIEQESERKFDALFKDRSGNWGLQGLGEGVFIYVQVGGESLWFHDAGLKFLYTPANSYQIICRQKYTTAMYTQLAESRTIESLGVNTLYIMCRESWECMWEANRCTPLPYKQYFTQYVAKLTFAFTFHFNIRLNLNI